MKAEDCKDSPLESVVQPQQDARRAIESGVQPAANVLAKLRDRLVDMQTDANYMVLEAVDEKRWDDATAQRHAAEAFDSIIDIIDELSEANQ